MRSRSMVRTDLRLSEIGFGCGPTAGLIVGGSRQVRREAVARALALGISYFDTAPAYGNGLSESHLGETLHDLGARPVIGTKVVLEMEDLEDIPGAVLRSVEQSLGRLCVDAVELLHLHNRVASQRAATSSVGVGCLLSVEDLLGPSGVLEAFEELQRQGKVRHIGFCAFGGELPAINRVIESGRFQSLLVYYNILNPTAARHPPLGFRGPDYGQVMGSAAAQGMGMVLLRVLAGGALGGQGVPHPQSGGIWDAAFQEDQARAGALGFLEEGQALPQAAIRFGLMSPEVSTVLVGFSDVAQIEVAAACSGAEPLSAETLARLEELYRTDFGLRPTG